MKKTKTIASIIIMLICGFIGLFVGGFLLKVADGVTWGILISGFACVIYAIDNINL